MPETSRGRFDPRLAAIFYAAVAANALVVWLARSTDFADSAAYPLVAVVLLAVLVVSGYRMLRQVFRRGD